MKLCVIPARGGSKRIARKNIRTFAGKPIISYSIKAALDSQLFDHVIVSTDDSEIAEASVSLGAETPFMRPAELSDDFTGTGDVVKHAVSWFLDQGLKLEHVCCLYATAPFIQVDYLKKGYEALIESGNSYAFSVTSFEFPVQRALRLTDTHSVEAMYPGNIEKRSQDLEDAFHDAGQFYWGTSEAFLNDEVIFSSSSIGIILPRHLVQDIDTIEDWHRAELMYEAWKSQKGSK